MEILAIMRNRKQKVQNTVAITPPPPILQSNMCVSNQGRSESEARIMQCPT